MATVNNQDEQNTGQTGPTQINGTAGASASGRGTAGAAAAPTSQVQTNAGQNAGYTDVGAYLNANQQGSQQLGNQVASNLTNQYNTTQGDINNSSQNFQGQVNQGYVPENTQLIQQAEADPTNFAYTQSGGVAPASGGYANSNVATPTTYTPNQGNIDAFQAQLNDQYTGPTTWGDYGTLQGEVAQANQEAALPTTAGGNNILASQVEQPTSSAGVNSLDALLLGAPGAASQVQAAAAPYANLSNYLDTQNTANTGAVTNAQNAAAQASQDALNAFTGTNGTLTNLYNNINTTATNDLSQAQAQQAALNADLAQLYGGQAVNTAPTSLGTYGGGSTPWVNTTNYNVNTGALSPQDLAALGITQDQWNTLSSALQQAGTSQYETGHNFGAGSGTSQIDLSQFLNEQTPTSSNINAATVATPQQYQEMNAIQQLLGSQAPQNEILNQANAQYAGTYNPASLNQFNYQAALQDAQNTAQQEVANAQSEANAISGAADLSHAQQQHTGGFLGGLQQDLTHPLTTLGAVINPASWLGNASNLIKGQQVSPTAINPSGTSIQSVAPAALAAYLLKASPLGAVAGAGAGGAGAITTGEAIAGAAAAKGGEVKDDGTISSFLDKQKKVKSNG